MIINLLISYPATLHYEAKKKIFITPLFLIIEYRNFQQSNF